jgi:hypothetical protein
MSSEASDERPLGVYLVALYLVLAGFLEPIAKYYDSGRTWSLVPTAENSLWTLGTDPLIYLAIAYLIWRFAWLGRIASLVLGYLLLASYLIAAVAHFGFAVPLTLTPLSAAVSTFHVLCLPAVVAYLQPSRQKKLFQVSLWDILLPGD